MSNGPSAQTPVESTSEPKPIWVTLKSSGKTQDCLLDGKSNVGELKEEAGRRFLISKEQVLLIFAGKILKDQETFLQHGIHNGDTVHVVVDRLALRGNRALQTASIAAPGCSAPQAAAGASASSGGLNLQPLLRSLRRDLLTLLDILSELPQHFQHHPELMSQVVQSSTIQSLLSKEGNPLTVAFVLGVSSLVSMRVMQSRDGKEKELSDRVVTEVLGNPFVQNILTNTQRLAQFLSENPELKAFAQETPQFGRLLSLSGLTKMMVTYKKLPRLAGTVTSEMSLEADMLDDLQSFRQLFVDIRQVLSGPEVQDELEERMLRQTIETSPSLIHLAKENASIGHLLSNPKVIGEIIRYIRKPEVKQEMDRNCDRILSNIESFPGGYNILQRMYQEVEEPIWSAMEQQHENSFATRGPASNQAVLPPRIENRTPLPDPWLPRPLQPWPQEVGKVNRQRGAAEEGNLHLEKVSKGTQVDFSLESSQAKGSPDTTVPDATLESSTSFLPDGQPPATESPAPHAPRVQDLQVLPGQPNASLKEGLSSPEEAEDNLETPTEMPPGSNLP